MVSREGKGKYKPKNDTLFNQQEASNITPDWMIFFKNVKAREALESGSSFLPS